MHFSFKCLHVYQNVVNDTFNHLTKSGRDADDFVENEYTLPVFSLLQ